MNGETDPSTQVEAYIARHPEEIQQILRQIRALIQEIAPEAVEKIAYQMPAFELNGPLVYYGVHPKHIGFYPTPSGIEAFKEELAGYQWAKGSVQFPLDRPMPYDLIRRMVAFRVEENRSKPGSKGKK